MRPLFNPADVWDHERDQLLATQEGTCAICRYPDDRAEGDLRHPVDHDHSCCPGRSVNRCCVRGVLCDRHWPPSIWHRSAVSSEAAFHQIRSP
ncbi:endonuclease domain-containing protein [Actinomadura sp. DC4]|uniref:endonuclease domain-containing protein n=1 Tax=Actinomadura sp. DC4 TaxID=3055069 RepID=UPI00339D417C